MAVGTVASPPAGETRADLRRRLIRLGAPVMGEELLWTLTQMVDMMLVGPLGAVAVAAVGLSTQPLWLLMSPFMGLGVGVAALVSRAVGASNPRDAEAAARQGLWLGAALAMVMGAFLWGGAESLIRWMEGGHVGEDVVAAGTGYLRALVPGLAALFTHLVLGDALRAAGDTRTPFAISGVVNGLNVLLDWALIYGHLGLPAMGVVGAGWATTVARLVGLLLLFLALLRQGGRLHLHPGRLLGLEPGRMLRILRVGVPAFVDRALGAGGFVVYVKVVATLGKEAMAAHHTAVIAEQISWMVGVGIATAVAAMVGQSLGAQNPERARRVIGEALRLGTAVMAVIGLFFIAFPGPYLRLFSRDPEVLALAVGALRVTGVGQIPMILSEVLQGALSGAGDTRVLAWISAFGTWVVRLALAYLFVLGLGWGLAGAWAAAVLDWVVRFFLLALRFRRGRWQAVRV